MESKRLQKFPVDLDIDEGAPLLPRRAVAPKKNEGSYARKSTEYFFCMLVAFPTAALNGLAAVLDNPEKLLALHSPDDFTTLLAEAKPARIVYGIVALSASEAVLSYLNTRYFVASGKAAMDLVKRTAQTMGTAFCCNELKEQNRAGIGENVLFVWSIGTSLIFAEMGSKALSFLGQTGEIMGFSLSMVVYFTTRYASTTMFSDRNGYLTKNYLGKLELLSVEAQAPAIPIVNNNVSGALLEFLQQIDNQWNALPKNPAREFLLGRAAPAIGCILVGAAALPIMCSWVPSSVQGAETLTQMDIGASTDYQNAPSLAFGVLSTALTLFFYELNIYSLPNHFFATALSIYEKMSRGDIVGATKLLSMTLLAAGTSYSTGIGFKAIAANAVSKGYLSYLGDWLSQLMPAGLLAATTGMLWSHLQDLINQVDRRQPPHELAKIKEVTLLNAPSLLKQVKVDFSGLPSSSGLFSFFFAREKKSDPIALQQIVHDDPGRHRVRGQ